VKWEGRQEKSSKKATRPEALCGRCEVGATRFERALSLEGKGRGWSVSVVVVVLK